MSPTRIPQTELDAIAEELEDELMPNTADLLGRERASDGQGGKTETRKARAKGVSCGLAPLRTRGGNAEKAAGGNPSATSQWVITFPAGTDVKATDQVAIAGTIYEVDEVAGDRGAFDMAVRVMAHIRDAGGSSS